MRAKLNTYKVKIQYTNGINYECLIKSEYEEAARDRLRLLPFQCNIKNIDIYQVQKQELPMFKQFTNQLLTIE